MCKCGSLIKRGGSVYCSNKCQQQQQLESKINMWLAGEWNGVKGTYNLSKTIRDYLLKQANYQCTKCSWGELNPVTGKSPLEIDHIDGNYMNNRPDNLRVLCPNCHSVTPTYKALNKGNGRTHRK